MKKCRLVKASLEIFDYFCTRILCMTMAKDINQLKIVLAEKKKTSKWLAGEMKKDPATVSKWCTNTSQPSIETLFEIARLLKVDPKMLINSGDTDSVYIKVSKEMTL